MQATSIDIKDMLEAESSLGLTFKDNLFVAKHPTSSGNCVVVIDTPGAPVHNTLGNIDNEYYYYNSVQIVVRNKSYKEGTDLIQDIVASLHSRANEVWNSTYYTLITCSSGPVSVEWDENERAILIVNFDVQRRIN